MIIHYFTLQTYYACMAAWPLFFHRPIQFLILSQFTSTVLCLAVLQNKRLHHLKRTPSDSLNMYVICELKLVCYLTFLLASILSINIYFQLLLEHVPYFHSELVKNLTFHFLHYYRCLLHCCFYLEIFLRECFYLWMLSRLFLKL